MAEFYTGGPLYLWEVDSLERLQIQYCPLEIAISRAPNIQTVQVIGRNNPYYFYTAGEDILTLQLDFHAQQNNFKDVKDRCNWLRSKTYNEGMAKPPGKFKLVFGKLFGNETWIIKGAVIKYSQFKNYTIPQADGNYGLNTDYYPSQAYVDLILGLEGVGSTNKYKPKGINRSDIFK